MVDEPKDVRLPLMVTRSEATAIDEWRYAQKIPTRAEAIRRLIEAGLGKAKPDAPSGGTGSGGSKKPATAGKASTPRTRKAGTQPKAAPTTPTTEEAQLRALREQGAR